MKALPGGKREGHDDRQTPAQNRRPHQPHSISLKGDNNAAPATSSQPFIWQYESPSYEAGSSLPALSLLVAETPTQPGLPVPVDKRQTSSAVNTRSLPRVEEIDTAPPHAIPAATGQVQQETPLVEQIDQFATMPNLKKVSSSRLPVPTNNAVVSPGAQAQVVESELSSWTAGRAANSSQAQLIADKGRKKYSHTFSLNPLDRVRWWLLHPGRIEFILWLGGTILLISVTCIFLLVSAFSFDWISPGTHSDSVFSNSSVTPGTAIRKLPTIITAPGLTFTLLNNAPLLPGQALHLRGQGFTPRGHVSFSLDGLQPLLEPNGHASGARSDEHGKFSATVQIGDGPAWYAGNHLLVAQDDTTKHLAALSFSIAPSPLGKAVTATPQPPLPGVTATPTQNQGNSGGGGGNTGNTPTPVPTVAFKTPVPTPTHGVTPTPTKPPATPTPGVTPTPGTTPTPGVTPSPTATAAIATPTGTSASPTSTSTSSSHSVLSNALNSDPAMNTELTHLSPLMWLLLACYSVAMLLLGIAGVLHGKKRS